MNTRYIILYFNFACLANENRDEIKQHLIKIVTNNTFINISSCQESNPSSISNTEQLQNSDSEDDFLSF